MASNSPKIDERTDENIVEQLENHVEQFSPEWKADKQKPDAVGALIRIAARMVKLVSDRLNQVPDKNFLAFLNLVGGQLIPPQPAKVPLTFYLAEGSPVDGLIPAYTQVVAPPAEGLEEEIVFETERELIVTTTQLKAVFVREPSQDKYKDCTLEATGQKEAAFWAFKGEENIPHSLYLTFPEIFSLPELKDLKLNYGDNNINNPVQTLPLNWSYWDGFQWNKIDNPSHENHQFTFANLPIPVATEVNGKTERWLQVNINNLVEIENLPKITNIQASIKINKSGLIPDVCLFNSTPLDLSKDFAPFGEQPQLNDTFYIALHDTFIKANTTVTIDVTLARIPVNTDSLKVIWEIGNGQEWQEIADNNERVRWIENSSAIQFTNNIQAKLQFPTQEKLPSCSTVNGETRYWIRARITQGHYGKPASQRQYPIYDDLAVLTEIVSKGATSIKVDSLDLFQDGDTIRIIPITGGFPEENHIKNREISEKKLNLESPIINDSLAVGTRIMRKSILTETIPATYDPPIIQSLKLTYDVTLNEDAIYLSNNDFNYSELFTTQLKELFLPFTPTVDQYPTLYLGFDQNFNNKTVTLYAQIESPLPGELESENQGESTLKPKIVWEYSSHGWQTLGVKDETQAFSQPGLIQFIAPADFQKIETFGQELYWLRIRWQEGNFRVEPRLRRISTNTTWAVQSTTFTEEILGSSNADPNQAFVTNNSPLLKGQNLEIREEKIPLEFPSDQVKIIRNDLDEIEEIWVLWQEVADFYNSSPGDRHYTLDRQTGEICFGNGITGMIPPRGRNNVKLSSYRIGGGKQGNIASNTINQMKTTIPYIDRVINLEAAAGGSQQETLPHFKERIPKQLRHRDRAVTIEDFEDLAYEASTDVARVKVVTPDLMITNFSAFNRDLWLDVTTEGGEKADIFGKIKDQAGKVKVIILPHSTERQPMPSLALLEQVETYIRSRCEAMVNLIVTAPKWQKVTIEVTITPNSLDNADIVRNTVRQRLETFLHPLTGDKGEGWQFGGRYPQESNFYALIQSISGVDHVNDLKIIPPADTSSPLSADTLIYSGDHIVKVD